MSASVLPPVERSLGARLDATGETERVVLPDGTRYPTHAELAAKLRALGHDPDA